MRRIIRQTGYDDNNQMSIDPRIVHIESRVDRLEADVSDIKIGVQKLLDRPVLPGFGQIIGTLVSTLVACSIILGFAEWRLSTAFEPVKSDINVLRLMREQEYSSLVDLRIKTAVLEERSAWLSGSGQHSNSAAKADKVN